MFKETLLFEFLELLYNIVFAQTTRFLSIEVKVAVSVHFHSVGFEHGPEIADREFSLTNKRLNFTI